MLAPSVDTFIERQAYLRETTGSPVVFKIPVAAVWPGGTKLNPTTGEPYDATIKPTSAAFTDVTKTVGIILKQGSPLRPQPDTQFSAAGEMSGMDIILDVAESDYPDVEAATEIVANGLTYRVEEAKPFSIHGIIYRRLIYGEER